MPFVRQFKPKDHFDHYHLYVFDSEVPGHLIVTNLNSTWANVIEFSRVLADIGQLRESIAARDPQVVMFVYISDYALTHWALDCTGIHCQTVKLVRGSIHRDSLWRYSLHSEAC